MVNSNGYTQTATSFTVRESVIFLLKAYVVLGLIFGLCKWISLLSSPLIALTWAGLTMFSTLGAAYHAVVLKSLRQHKYAEDGIAARLNNGRVLTLIVLFVISATCVASLVIDASAWTPLQWGILFATPLVYLGIQKLVGRFVATQERATYRMSSTIRWSSGILCGVLTLAYLIAMLAQPGADPLGAQEALTAAANPFENASSALIAEVGHYLVISNAVTLFGLSQTAGVSEWLPLLLRVALIIPALIAVANLIGSCSLSIRELKSVFLPLESLVGQDGASSPTWDRASKPKARYIATLVIMVALLVGGFLFANAKAVEIIETPDYQTTRKYVDERVAVAAYMIDDQWFDKVKVDQLRSEMDTRAQALVADVATDLAPLINAAYDQRIANVDAYLDWYYQPMRDYELLLDFATQFANSQVEELMTDKFEEFIDENVDLSSIEAYYNTFEAQLQALEDEYASELEQCKLEDDGTWKPSSVETLTDTDIEKPFSLGASKGGDLGRLVGSTAAGVASGIGVKFLAEKVLAKPFFEKMVGKLTASLAARGLITSGGAIVGNVVGAAAGLGIGIAIDWGTAKIDELMNRESYKQEIIDAIEESRASALALVEG